MPTLQEKMKTMVGLCTNCGVEVMDITKPRGRKALPNYREHEMEMSDGSILRVAVCDVCKALLVSGKKVQETADRILKHHKIFWQHNKVDDRDEKRPDRFDKMKIDDPGTTLLKVRTKRLSSFDADKQEKLAAERRAMEARRIAREKEEAELKKKKDLEEKMEQEKKEHERLEKEEERNIRETFKGKDPSKIK